MRPYHQSTTADPPTCRVDSAGRLQMHYLLSDTDAWAGCMFSDRQNMESFDSEHGNGGALEVVYCMDEETVGGLNLWYAHNASTDAQRIEYRKFLRLLAADEAAAIGCRRRVFSPGNACFPGPWDGLPDACTGECQAPRPACHSEFTHSELDLVAEFGSGTRTGAVTLVSIAYYPPGCTCRDDGDCASGRYCSRDPVSADCADGSCAGICTRTDL